MVSYKSSTLIGVGVILLFSMQTALAIYCYQCMGTDSNHPFQCNEFLQGDNDLQPDSCDSVYGAQYCIKHVGRFEAFGLFCYQCTSNSTINCGDRMIHLGGIAPESCDHVFEALYCIKMSGGIGTKRYCSSHDLGNYCNYVQQPGDKLEYRSCVYTCTGDGCNSSTNLQPITSLLFLSIGFILIYFSKQI